MDPFDTSVTTAFHTPAMQGVEDTFVQNVRTHLNKFLDLWRQFGLEEDSMSSRLDELWAHVSSLLKQMYEEDFGSYQKVNKRIRTLITSVESLAKALQVKANEANGPLFKKEQALREELERLTKLKKERLAAQSELMEQESEHRRAMILPPFQENRRKVNSEDKRRKVPSEEDIENLRQRVSSLREERERRRKLLEHGSKELIGAMERGEWLPETAFERDLVTREVEELPLSLEFVDLMESTLGRVRSQFETLEAKKKVLMERLKRLWRTLDVGEVERKKLSEAKCSRLQTLVEMESEVERLEEMRRSRAGSLVEGLKREIEELWDKCLVSQSERRKFRAQTYSEVDGGVLELHEDEVEKWRRYHEGVRQILEKIEKRQQLWDEMVALEMNSRNPDRFRNRGGNLLIEEKERKRLQKELPSLENNIFKDIEEYELWCGRTFRHYGEDYRTFVSNQWAQRLNQKEFQKVERRRQRSLESSAPTTPTRKLSRTPGATPKKVSKSSEGSSASCTPLANRTPNRTNAPVVGRLFVPLENGQRSVQKEDRSPNGTTYTDFAEGLDQSNFHSSAIERHNTSKRGRARGKKVGILRKSARNMGRAVAKLTPKRGKLGLPFLI